jgi:hypothetical protein
LLRRGGGGGGPRLRYLWVLSVIFRPFLDFYKKKRGLGGNKFEKLRGHVKEGGWNEKEGVRREGMRRRRRREGGGPVRSFFLPLVLRRLR